MRLYARPVLSRNTACCVLRPRAAAWNASPVLYDSDERVEIVALRGAHPAALRQHDGDRLARDQLGFVDCLRGGALDDAAAAVVAEFFGGGQQLLAHQLLEPRLALQDLVELLCSSA